MLSQIFCGIANVHLTYVNSVKSLESLVIFDYVSSRPGGKIQCQFILKFAGVFHQVHFIVFPSIMFFKRTHDTFMYIPQRIWLTRHVVVHFLLKKGVALLTAK